MKPVNMVGTTVTLQFQTEGVRFGRALSKRKLEPDASMMHHNPKAQNSPDALYKEVFGPKTPEI